MKSKIYFVFAVTLLLCFFYSSNHVLATGCSNVTNPGMIGNAQSGCSPFDPSLIQNLQSPSGGSGTLQYVWLYKNSSTGNNFQQISGATSSSYDPGPLTESTYFRRCARRYGCNDYVGESNIICMTVTNCCNATIGALSFYNLNNSSTFSTITNLGTYDLTNLPSNWNIEAAVTGSNIGSVKFDITGPVSSSHIENSNPYRTPGDAIALNLTPGFYTVVVKAYNQSNAGGTKCDEKTICFTLTQCNATLDNIIVYDIGNTTSFLTLTNGGTYNLSTFPANWNIEALVSGSSAQSVQFNISGSANSSNIENTIPYRTPTDAVALNLAAGTYTVNAKVYSQDNAGGTKCDEKTITFTLTNCAITANAGPDKSICLGGSTTLYAAYTGAGNCSTQGITDCNHTLANSGGWLLDPALSTVCGDNAGTKLWTQGGNGTSYLTLDLGSVIAAGTQICVNMKLEHCSNSSTGYSNAKIQSSTISNSGFINLTSSVTFSQNTYQEFCYNLASSARYIKILDNGNCAFRVDYVKYITAGTNNSAVSFMWSTGATTSSINVSPNSTIDYWVKVTDCKGCTATDTVKVIVNNPNDNNACTTDACDLATGQPTNTPIVCNDQNACTTDGCNPSTGCTFTPIVCNDNNACTTDGCNPSTGCTYTPIVCNDQNACTTDGCNPSTGCTYTQIICNDNNACTTDGCNPSNGCTYTAVSCDDQNACTTDGCNPTTGCTYTTVNCDDSNACTTDGCNPSTGCYYSPVNTNDNNACTIDGCDPVSGPYNNPISYSDNNICTDDYCDPITGPYYVPVNVDDNNPCTVDACDPVNGITHVSNTPNCSINGSNFCCGGDPVQLCVPISAGAVSYLWSNGATTRCTQVFVTGTYTVTVTNASGCSSSCNKTVTFYEFPEIIMPSFGSVCDTISGGVVLTGATPVGGTYSGTGVIAGVFYPALAGLGPHMITYTYSNGHCESNDSAEVVVIACNCIIPPNPTINGLDVICTNTQGVYTAVGATGATNYVWTVPQGANILSGQGTATVVVEFTTACQSGNICVKASNPCGEAQLVCKAIVAISKVPVLGTLTGQTTAVCSGLSLQYCIPSVPNAISYIWTIPANTQIASGQGTNCITLSILSGFTTGNVTVKADNCKGFSGPKTITLRKLALQPGVIAGSTSNLCQKTGVVYTIANVTNATSYLWTVPAGGTLVNGQGTTSITVDYNANFVSGNVTVRGVNACGNGPVRNLAVKAKAATPTVINGLTQVCEFDLGVGYNVSSQSGVNYNWTVPSGSTVVSGQGNSNVSVNWGVTSGNVTVVPSNGCGVSPSKSLAVTVISCSRVANSSNATSESIKVYPNPVKSDLMIEYKSESVSDYTITLTDVIGKTVYSNTIQAAEGNNQQSIKVDNFSKGLYFVNISGIDMNKTTRITIE